MGNAINETAHASTAKHDPSKPATQIEIHSTTGNAHLPVSRCSECHAYTYQWNENPGHAPECSLAPEGTLRELLAHYVEAWRELNHRVRIKSEEAGRAAARQVRKAKEQVVSWQGRCAILKAENNALRKRLRQLESK